MPDKRSYTLNFVYVRIYYLPSASSMMEIKRDHERVKLRIYTRFKLRHSHILQVCKLSKLGHA